VDDSLVNPLMALGRDWLRLIPVTALLLGKYECDQEAKCRSQPFAAVLLES